MIQLNNTELVKCTLPFQKEILIIWIISEPVSHMATSSIIIHTHHSERRVSLLDFSQQGMLQLGPLQAPLQQHLQLRPIRKLKINNRCKLKERELLS